MIKIFFAYKHTDKPWGGANNFIRALYNELVNDSSFVVHHDISSPSDILFFSHLSCGPGNVERGFKKNYSISEIKELKKKSKAKLVVRAVNLNINSYYITSLKYFLGYLRYGLWQDIQTIKFLNMADFVIFQSEFQKSFFKKWGYKGKKSVVIHNSASNIFENKNFIYNNHHEPLRIVSNTFSPRKSKKHDIIAKISFLKGVCVTHIGAWPEEIKTHNVDIRGILTQEEMINIYKNSDYLLHPAVQDPCPNSVIEALYFGLPVIYNKQKGSSEEIVNGNGFSFDENNLEKTIRLARENFIIFKENLASRRNYYSINRAVSEYKKVFDKLGKA